MKTAQGEFNSYKMKRRMESSQKRRAGDRRGLGAHGGTREPGEKTFLARARALGRCMLDAVADPVVYVIL